jgi:1,4-alpha-glucan branching enzyme
LVFLRKGDAGDPLLLVVCHFNINYMPEYAVGVPHAGNWREVLNSDAKEFGGSGIVNGDLKAEKKPEHGKDYSVTFKLPPLSVMIFEGEVQKEGKSSKQTKGKSSK